MEKKIIIFDMLDRQYRSIWNQFANQFENLETRLYGMFVEGFEGQWRNSSLKVTSCGKTEVVNSKKLYVDEWKDNKVSDTTLAEAFKKLLNTGIHIIVSEEEDCVTISTCLPYDE